MDGSTTKEGAVRMRPANGPDDRVPSKEQQSMNTLQHNTDSDSPVTESAAGPEVAQLADEIAENLMSIGRGLGAKDGVIVEAALRAVAETAASKDDEVRELIKAWRVDWERRTHRTALDHRYDRPAREWKPSVHPEDYCNKIDCTVAPHVAPDGRAISNYGIHKTYTETLTSGVGDVMRVSLAKSEDVNGLAERGVVFMSVVEQDAEWVDHDGASTFHTELSADEADALADALKTRARALRYLESQESKAAAEAASAARFPQLVDGPAAETESA